MKSNNNNNWKLVPVAATSEFLADTNGKPVLVYSKGEQIQIAWIEFDPMEGGYVWMDDTGRVDRPTHYQTLPEEKPAADEGLEKRAFRAANRLDVPDEVRKLINELREQYLEEIAGVRSQNGKLADEIERLRSRAEKAEAEAATSHAAWQVCNDARNASRLRAEAAEATCDQLRAAPKATVKMTSADSDLLAALKAIQKIGVLNPTNSPVVRRAIDTMDAAIAKAEGGGGW